MTKYLYLVLIFICFLSCREDELQEPDFYLFAEGRFNDDVDIRLSIDDYPSKLQSGRGYSIPGPTSDTFYERFIFEFTISRGRNSSEYYGIEFWFIFPSSKYDSATTTSIHSIEQLESLIKKGKWSLDETQNQFARVVYRKDETLYYEPWYDQFAKTENLFEVTSVERYEDEIFGEGLIVKGLFEVDILSVVGEKGSISLDKGEFKILLRRGI